MCVRAVVRMTPPPKQERQDTTKAPLDPSDTFTWVSQSTQFVLRFVYLFRHQHGNEADQERDGTKDGHCDDFGPQQIHLDC